MVWIFFFEKMQRTFDIKKEIKRIWLQVKLQIIIALPNLNPLSQSCTLICCVFSFVASTFHFLQNLNLAHDSIILLSRVSMTLQLHFFTHYWHAKLKVLYCCTQTNVTKRNNIKNKMLNFLFMMNYILAVLFTIVVDYRTFHVKILFSLYRIAKLSEFYYHIFQQKFLVYKKFLVIVIQH